MPDFEALIKHQQQRNARDEDRLILLKSKRNNFTHNTYNPLTNLVSSFVAALIGSSIGVAMILFLYTNKFFSLVFPS